MASQLQNTFCTVIANGYSLTAGTQQLGRIDTLGYDHCEIILMAATAGTPTAIPTTTLVQEANSGTGQSNYTSISGYTANSSSTGWITAVGATSTTSAQAPFYRASIPLGGNRARYLQVNIAGVATSCLLSGVALLSRAEEAPVGTSVGGTFVQVPT